MGSGQVNPGILLVRNSPLLRAVVRQSMPQACPESLSSEDELGTPARPGTPNLEVARALSPAAIRPDCG